MENTYQSDKVIGILVIIFSVCGAIGGLLMALGGGIIGTAGASAAAGQQDGNPAAVAAVGGGVLIIGLIIAAINAVQIFGGIKILQSARIGFMVTMILALISLVLNILSFNLVSILFIAIQAALAYYCWGRMNGKIGPAVTS